MSLSLSLSLSLANRAASGPPTPATILAGVTSWFRADLGITTATGVSEWRDQVGSAHLLQGTGANQPVYNSSDAAYNNRPTVQCDVLGKFLAASGFVSSSQTFSVWMVGEFSTAGGVIVGLVPSGSASPIIYRLAGNVAINAGAALGSGVTSDTKRAVLATFADTSSFVGVDNWLTGGVTGAGGSNGGTRLALFAYSAGDFGSLGKIAELVVQSGTPTAGEKTAMAAYVLDRYGITVT